MCAINNEPIQQITSKEKIQVHTRCLKSSLLVFNPGICSLKKTGKQIEKNDFWYLCPGLNSVTMDPKIFKKLTMLHIVSRSEKK